MTTGGLRSLAPESPAEYAVERARRKVLKAPCAICAAAGENYCRDVTPPSPDVERASVICAAVVELLAQSPVTLEDIETSQRALADAHKLLDSVAREMRRAPR